MAAYTTATPYIASYVLLERDGKFAFVLRSNTGWMNGYYGLPSGKVEQNERFAAAAIREAKEEVGVDIAEADLQPVLTVHRREQNVTDSWVDVFFVANEYTGEPFNAEPDVHSELAWLDPQSLPQNVIPSVKSALEHIAAGRSYAEYGWNGETGE